MELIAKWITTSIDLAFLLPPINQIRALGVSPIHLNMFFFTCLTLLLIAVVNLSCIGFFSNNTIVCLVIGLCVITLGLIGLGKDHQQARMAQALIKTSWFPLVVTVRFIEGASIGSLFRKRLGLYLPVAVIIPAAGSAFFVLDNSPIVPVFFLKSGLIVLGAALAALSVTKAFKIPDNSSKLSTSFVKFSMFITFCSASFYIYTDTTTLTLYTYLFPTGFFVGLLTGNKTIRETH